MYFLIFLITFLFLSVVYFKLCSSFGSCDKPLAKLTELGVLFLFLVLIVFKWLEVFLKQFSSLHQAITVLIFSSHTNSVSVSNFMFATVDQIPLYSYM